MKITFESKEEKTRDNPTTIDIYENWEKKETNPK